MKSPQYLTEYGRLCEPRLREFLDRKGARFAWLPVDLRPAHALLRDYALRGGKRIRGALVMLTGGEGALDASVGMELLHAYLLIHDDFMDRDAMRRGGPRASTWAGAWRSCSGRSARPGRTSWCSDRAGMRSRRRGC
jgi:geranylgeranyl pyrophosphate synthase